MSTVKSLKKNLSLWAAEDSFKTKYPQLQGKAYTDIAVIGGGIAGLTCALLLQKAGKQVTLIEAGRIGQGVTGYSTGHLTTMLDTDYSSLISNFGEETARLVASSLREAIQTIHDMVQEYSIDCDFSFLPGYLYAETAAEVEALKQEWKASQKIQMNCLKAKDIPLPFTVNEAILYNRQAQFNPLKYVQALSKAFLEAGGKIYENSRMIKNTEDEPYEIETAQGSLQAQAIVFASGVPLGLKPVLQSKVVPYRSYVIGVRVQNLPPEGLYWDMKDPYYYTRHASDELGKLLVIGGEDHKMGENEDAQSCYRRLEEYAQKHYEVKSVDYYWLAQLYEPADGLPYIGKLNLESIYVATGFSGDGLTFGTLAGLIISDQILGNANPWSAIYDANRLKPLASAKMLATEAGTVVKHLVIDRMFEAPTDDLNEVQKGEGKIVEINEKKVAAYRDEKGELHLMSPVCTHAKCIVAWNNAEGSWDCPCHGGRFSATGEVVYGPPLENLKSI